MDALIGSTRQEADHGASRYRPEIDGLRALAVVPVVLFHAGVSALSGGFVGVDVFFVISGFLITGIIHREMVERRFSLATFYQRRARRILPNLLAVMTVATLVALVLLIPVDLKRYGQSVIAALGFAANIYFWFRTGYFEGASGQLPLLHIWSLGVEEQYYVFFPLVLLLLVARHPKRLTAIVCGLLVLSLALAVWQVRSAPDAAFYLPFARWWELMIGSLLAIGAIPQIGARLARQIIALLGFGAIIAAILLYTDATPFPGFAALAPCLGAAAIIHCARAREGLIGRLLASEPMRWTGLVSYSLYLWHWPVIVFVRYALQRNLAPIEIVGVVFTTLVLALAAYWLVEKPMRRATLAMPRLLVLVGSGCAILVLAGLAIEATSGLPERYPASVRRLALATQDINPERERCDTPSLARITAGKVCTIGVPGTPRFALIGDSFGDALAPGVDRAAREAGVSGIVVTVGGCAIMSGVGNSPRCRQIADATIALVARTPSIERVVLIERWSAWITSKREGLFAQRHMWLRDDQTTVPGVAENRAVVARGIDRTIATLAPRKLTFVVGLPEQLVHVPQAATVRAVWGGDLAGVPRARYDQRQATTKAVFAAARRRFAFEVIDLGATMCTVAACPIMANGAALYVDDNHPTRAYAVAMSHIFAPLLAPLARAPGNLPLVPEPHR